MPDEAAEDVAWLISHLRAMVATAPTTWARHHLTLPQLSALHCLRVGHSLTLTGLATALGTRPPATCAMVDRLVDAGMVERVLDLGHRSRVELHLTPQAAQMLGDIDAPTATHFRTVLQMLSPEQQQAVEDLLVDLICQCLTARPSRDQRRKKKQRQ